MTEWLGAEDATIWHGDVRELLREVPDGQVQCIVTSPPYWGLRDYGVEGQIGLERTPAEYVAALVDVFGEVRRVLRDDGCCWLNLGDCYATGAGAVGNCPGGGEQGARWLGEVTRHRDAKRRDHGRPYVNGRGEPQDVPTKNRVGPMTQPNRMPLPGLKPKDLVGVPWRVALALQADGWYLRADCIWSKPNPMPESVQDRPTKAHEYVFFLTKSERYYWDTKNARETAVSTRPPGNRKPLKGVGDEKHRTRAGLHLNAECYRTEGMPTTRNMRSVWDITTRPYPGAHFATFPPEIPRRCIRASTPEGGCCSVCRRPYRRIVEKGEPLREQMAACGADSTGEYHGQATKAYAAAGAQNASDVKRRILAGMVERRTVGWGQQCQCAGSTPVPSLVLDPFAGSGTTLAVAVEEGRRALGMELNPEYICLALDRIEQVRGRERQTA